MTERIVPKCHYCYRPAEGVYGISTTLGGQEPEKATCRDCAEGDIQAMVDANMIRSAGFTTWADLELTAPSKHQQFAPRR